MGRFPDWQTDILAHIFNSEIWNPGDKTVMLLEWQFKGRSVGWHSALLFQSADQYPGARQEDQKTDQRLVFA